MPSHCMESSLIISQGVTKTCSLCDRCCCRFGGRMAPCLPPVILPARGLRWKPRCRSLIISGAFNTLPDKIYHVTVMPCYDKKLEAARDDFVFSVYHGVETDPNDAGSIIKVPEVDIVLTSGEVLDLVQV
ncbi:hypothetical protein KSP39_PZI007843 [Platanthera zijinensis]|uniref:Iron hydrogenase large subunit C-terminal domain-containing protein n=1 Tax=Platanthera zijinensis TaxID=2320716 RepID=A0AAP0BMI4_9ASPA